MSRLLWLQSFAFLSVLLLIGFSAPFVEAADPPWPAGLPWPTSVPWPTPHPLQPGVPWSPGAPSFTAPAIAPNVPPAGPVYLPTATTVYVAPPAYALPTSTPLPPIILSSGIPQAAPAAPLAASVPPALPALSAPSAPSAQPNPPSNAVNAPAVPPSSVTNDVASPPGSVNAPGPSPVDSPPYEPVSGGTSPALTSLVSPGPVADGQSRATAFAADDSSRTMPSGGRAWFLIGSGSVQMNVWLDANPHLNVDLSIFAPNGSADPVGRGTFEHANPDRLVWSGGNWNADGDWYALVTNLNPVTLSYRIGSSAHEIGPKTCNSYWEYIGTAHVYWTKCQ